MYDQPVAGTIRVLVADNTRIHTELLADALRRDLGLEVTSSDSDSRGLLAAAAARVVDVLVISSNLDEEPQRGCEVLRELRASHPDIRAIMLLDSSKREMILDAFRAGAKGIFTRNESVETLAKSVRCVHQGQIWANSREMAFAVEALAASPTVRAVDANGLDLLSKREMEVVRSLSEGLSNREIAKRLGLSQHTIKNYLFRIFDKLGVSSRVELLFMTLNQESTTAPGFQQLMNHSANGRSAGEASLAEFQQAAEQGAPVAQLALAQLYRTRKASAKDMVNAFMWYVIAGEQGAQARKELDGLMTKDQILEAERRAAEWLGQAKRLPAKSIEHLPGRAARMASATSSA